MARRALYYSFLLILLTTCGKKGKEVEDKAVFRFNFHEVLGSLDPAFATAQATTWATTQLFNGLVELDSNLKVQPSLATRWDISDDLLTYTFYLRKGVRFHNHPLFPEGKGRKLSAKDVEYSFRRICDTTSIYNKGIWIFKDKVLRHPSGRLSDTCFVALNDSTFRVHLQTPSPHFLQILAMPYAFVVPRDLAEHYGREFRSNPVGTGPFRFKQWEEGNTLIFLKNETYWKEDQEGNTLPYLDAVQISFTPDKGQAFRSFMLGGQDFVNGVESSFIDDVLYQDGTFKAYVRDQFNCRKLPYLNTEYIGIQLNPEAPCYKGVKEHPFLTVDFRKALSYAVDRNRLVTSLRNGVGEPGTSGMVPTAVPYFDQSKVEGYDFDPTKAMEYYEKSGWKGRALPPMKITVAKDYKDLASFLVKGWEDILGVSIQVEIKEPKAVRSMANNGEVAFFRASWLGDYPDAENYLALFESHNHTPFGPNKTHFTNPIFDSLYQEARLERSLSARYSLYEQMDQKMIEEAPVIVLFYDEMIRLSQRSVKNFPANAMGVLKLETVRLEANQ